MEATGLEMGGIYRHFDSKQRRLEGSLVVSRLQRKEDACALTCDHLEEHLETNVVRRGRNLCYVECEITDERGRLVAKAASTCLVLMGDGATGR